MAPSVAAGAAEALADALTGADLATRTDIAALRTELKGDITTLRTELKGDITFLRTEVKNDIELLRRDIIIKFGSMMVISVGILLAAIRYLPPHP